MSPPSAGVVIPVRAFTGGFARLAGTIDAAARAHLAQRCAERVMAAAGDRVVVVVTSAPEVRAWAQEQRRVVIDDPGTLDAAADAGRRWLADRGCQRVVVAHGDLPRARSLAPVAGDGPDPVAAIVPCHRGDGTPVLAVPTGAPFRFAYGPGSFRRHVDEAHRLGLEARIVHDPELAFDVDEPADLDGVPTDLLSEQTRSRS
jgi:2-phospho-L-lactate guanylyltransferase